MFAKHYDVAWGCSCFEPLLISIWNILKIRPSSAQGSPRALLALPASSCSLPSCSRGYDGVFVAGDFGRGRRRCEASYPLRAEGEGKAGAESAERLQPLRSGGVPEG